MPETFQAVAVVALALLPGGLYVWSFERLVGRWGIGLSDRVLRFVGFSAVLHAAIAPLTYRLWTDQIVSGQLGNGNAPLWLWIVPLLYVGLPIGLGSLAGWGTRSGKSWAKVLAGPSPAPRAWGHLFAWRPDGWIRLRLKSGVWLAGAFASAGTERSFAAGYPEPQDLYLSRAAEVDPDTGAFQYENGAPVVRDSGILIRWDEVEYLEFTDG